MRRLCLAALLCLPACDDDPSATGDALPGDAGAEDEAMDGAAPDATPPMTPTDRVHVPEEDVQTATINGLELAWFEYGEGPLVVMLHGFPDTPHTWDTIAPAVAADGYRVVTPFLRGYAPSEPAMGDAYGAVELGRDVLGLIDALGAESAVVIGHDWGASAAYAAANLEPDRVHRLITLAIPHPRAFLSHPDALAGSPHFAALAMPDAAEAFAADDFSGVDALYARWSPAWTPPEGELEAVKNCFAALGSLEAALGYYRAFAAATPEPVLFAQTTVPTLTFAGLEDGAGDPAPFTSHADGFIDPPEVVVLPVGHFIQREAEAEVLAGIRAFLAED